MQIRDNSKEAASGLDALAGTLDKVKTAANGFNMRRVSTQLSNLSAVVNGINASGVRRLNDLSFALDRMGKLGNIKISSSVGRQLQSISTAAASLQNVDLSRIAALAETLRPLSELRGSRLTSYINQLGRLPEVVQALERSKLDAFVADSRELTVAMTPLGDTMEKVARGFNALPTRIQRMVKQTEKFNDTMRRSNTIMQKSTSGGLWGFLNSTHTKWLALAGVFGMLSNTIGKFVHDSASFEENLNLFTIAMGRYAEEAYDYAEAVQYALGIDVSAWMRNQGVFMQIATGFGVVEDKAYTMSQGLTQIAYDIASFYNIGVDTAMEKVQSGISGELEPLRRLGYALDAATLQQIAYEHGISQSINTMTQAQKSQLRYIAIMEQSENAMGDMARTIDSPANSMRVLAMQAEQLGRALGNLILPVLTKILPYVQAVTVALTDIINHLAVLSGFTMPEISKDNMGGLASGAESVEDALLGSADAAKELRNATLGLDELNVISESSGVGTAGSGYDLPLDLESYKFFDENYENKVAKIAKEIKDALEPLTTTFKLMIEVGEKAQPMLDGLASKLSNVAESLIGVTANNLIDLLRSLSEWMEENPDTLYNIGEMLGSLVTSAVALKLPFTLASLVFKMPSNIGAIFPETEKEKVGSFIGSAIGASKQGGAFLYKLSVGADVVLKGISIAAIGAAVLESASNDTSEALGSILTAVGTAATVAGGTFLTGAGAVTAGLAGLITIPLAFVTTWGVKQAVDLEKNKYDTSILNPEEMVGEFEGFGDKQGVIDWSETLSQDVKDKLKKVADEAKESVKSETASVFDEFEKQYYSEEKIVSASTYDTANESLSKNISNLADNLVFGVGDKLPYVKEKTSYWVWDVFTTVDGEIEKNEPNTVAKLQESGFNFSKALTDAIEELAPGRKDTVNQMASDVISAFNKPLGISSGTSTVFDKAGKALGNSLTSGMNSVKSAATTAARALADSVVNPISAAVDSVKTMLNSLNVGASVFDRPSSYADKFKIPLFASGGYPDEGQLFIARERGAEMVGSIGGRTAVANNDQIVEAIRLAVYDAMVAAGGSEGGDTYVYLDSDPVAARIEKRQREKGQKIYSGGVLA